MKKLNATQTAAASVLDIFTRPAYSNTLKEMFKCTSRQELESVAELKLAVDGVCLRCGHKQPWRVYNAILQELELNAEAWRSLLAGPATEESELQEIKNGALPNEETKVNSKPHVKVLEKAFGEKFPLGECTIITVDGGYKFDPVFESNYKWLCENTKLRIERIGEPERMCNHFFAIIIDHNHPSFVEHCGLSVDYLSGVGSYPIICEEAHSEVCSGHVDKQLESMGYDRKELPPVGIEGHEVDEEEVYAYCLHKHSGATLEDCRLWLSLARGYRSCDSEDMLSEHFDPEGAILVLTANSMKKKPGQRRNELLRRLRRKGSTLEVSAPFWPMDARERVVKALQRDYSKCA